ncbi:FlgM family anti-sigma-28 factor [Natranaerovirga hydrolytica]|uniref:Negative regulator of flagellin synthesis n=1 Tax=Natranaerovirga hydrolytica TaxID=680378 RepID=A0A4R1MKV1_9FIRM|nr:flagellar biosynthesis anti-sigma factor FlgM [Natranaerovirga hydrolytica]TCK93376.1 FlgM family anti-sigma-28 factor [Natranaerovirga hydrolytica]
MRIDGVNKINNIYNKNATKVNKIESTTKEKDSLNISNYGKDLQKAKKVVKDTFDIRQSKVDYIKGQMESGTYNIGAKEVADKLVDNYFDSKI